jgi:hypothetical protein
MASPTVLLLLHNAHFTDFGCCCCRSYRLLSSAKRAASAAAFSAAAAAAAAFIASASFFRPLEDVRFEPSTTNKSPNVNALGAPDEDPVGNASAPDEDPVGNASAPDAPNADSLNK